MEHVQELVDAVTQTPVGKPAPVVSTNGDPVYDCAQKPDSLRWHWPPPSQLPEPAGPVDVTLMLRTADFAQFQRQEETARHTQLVSEALNKLRMTVGAGDTQPHENGHRYTHLNLLYRLARLFNNTNTKRRAYFAASQTTGSNLTGEYVQALIVLAQRQYTATESLPDDAAKSLLLDEAHAAMEEACRASEYVLRDTYEQKRRQCWQYVKSPTALSPDALDQQTRLANFHQSDTDKLRAFLRDELGAPRQMEAHRLLMQLQRSELKARRLETAVAPALAEKNVLVYEKLAPVIEAALRDYRAIATLLQETPTTSLAVYAVRMRNYWETRQQYWLAASDFALYTQGTDINATEYGKRALRRLDALAEIAPSEAARVQELYDTVQEEMQGQYGAGSLLEMPMIVPFESAPPPKFSECAQHAWQQFTARNTGVEQALQALQTLKEQRDQPQELFIVPVDDERLEEPALFGPSGASSNACKAATAAERQRWLAYLLTRRSETDGAIYLEKSECDELERVSQETTRVVAENKALY